MDWSQIEKDAHEELMDDFRTYLRADQGLTMSTARVYAATLSGAIRKGTFGYDDETGIRRYFDGLVERRPATASTLQAVWQHFRTYMATQHGETLCELGDSAGGNVPEAAVLDLRGELRVIPTSEFIELRWGAVHKSGAASGGYEIEHTGGTGKTTVYLLTPRGVAALEALKSWGYPSGARKATSLIMPQAPDDLAPITRQRLSRIRQRELARRQRVASVNAVVAAPSSDSTLDLKAPREVPRPLEMSLRWQQEPQIVTAPSPLTEEQKLGLYQQWLSEAPPDSMDRMYEFASVSTAADPKTLARWRRVQWELRRSNDMGPPPQSYLSVPSPSRYAPSEPPLPATAPPTAAGSSLTSADVFDDPPES